HRMGEGLYGADTRSAGGSLQVVRPSSEDGVLFLALGRGGRLFQTEERRLERTCRFADLFCEGLEKQLLEVIHEGPEEGGGRSTGPRVILLRRSRGSPPTSCRGGTSTRASGALR